MNKRLKIVLLGLMIWIIKFIAGFFSFSVFGVEAGGPPVDVFWINGILEFSLGISLALALFLLYRDKGQDYKNIGWKTGITWYVILLSMDLIVLVGLLGVELQFWFPSIFTYFMVAIIPIIVGYLLAEPRIEDAQGS